MKSAAAEVWKPPWDTVVKVLDESEINLEN
jgi:hypothetical protein